MAYSRWSSDNFSCDVYCYWSCYDKFTIHVAGNRIDTADMPKYSIADKDWIEKSIAQSAWLGIWGDIKRKPIGLPHDGATFQEDTPEEAIERLIALREMGYVVPEYAIEGIRGDIPEFYQENGKEK